MTVAKPRQYLSEELKRQRKRQATLWLLSNKLLEIASTTVFHDDACDAGLLYYFIQANDVGMVEQSEDLQLPLDAPQILGRHRFLFDYLDGHLFSCLFVMR